MIILYKVKSMFHMQAAVEEGIVVGGGSALLRLASEVDSIKGTLENYEQQVCGLSEYSTFIILRTTQYTEFDKYIHGKSSRLNTLVFLIKCLWQ